MNQFVVSFRTSALTLPCKFNSMFTSLLGDLAVMVSFWGWMSTFKLEASISGTSMVSRSLSLRWAQLMAAVLLLKIEQETDVIGLVLSENGAGRHQKPGVGQIARNLSQSCHSCFLVHITRHTGIR